MFFSIIVPVYNRPAELQELLQSLTHQTFTDFEVVIIEDGSQIGSRDVVENYTSRLSCQYIQQENTGQGFARNHGMKKARGVFFVILDSDVILPPDYLEVLYAAISNRKLDAFGGPDAAAADFSVLQKAMDFAMTSFWTTGGIRGNLPDPGKYQARGFNMGVSREVFDKTGGFIDANQGEDIEWSIRIKKAGFKLELVQEAYVYHKRKNTLGSFAKQAFSFGRNRVNVSRYHPEAIKLVHLLPTAFLLFFLSMVLMSFSATILFRIEIQLFILWSVLLVFSAVAENKSIAVGLMSWVTSVVQLCSYGLGLPYEWLRKTFRG